MNDQNSIKTMVLALLVLSASLLFVGCDGEDDEKEDSSPEVFSFDDQTAVALNEYIVSEPFTVGGINTASVIAVVGGEYAINDGDFTDVAGEVNLDDEVRVRVLSSTDLSSETEAILTIGDVSDTFTVTTIDIGLNAREGFKSVIFSWPAALEGVSEYRVLEKRGDSDEFLPVVGANLGIGDTSLTMGLAVHKHDWRNSEYKLDRCVEERCSSTDEVSIFEYMRGSIGYIKAENSEENDLFSVLAISADGNTIAVGARGEDSGSAGVDADGSDNSLADSGAVYIYTKDADSWRFQSYVKSPTPGESDAFGSSLALSADGTLLAVGVPNDDSGDFVIDGNQDDASASDSGAVYIYQRFDDSWLVQHYLKASNGAAGDVFGSHLAINDLGSTLIVAAPLANNGTVKAGAVYIYAAEGDAWVERQVIASSAAVEERFGRSLSISNNGERIAVGAPNFDGSTDNSNLTGKAYVFDFIEAQGQWALSTELSASNARHDMQFALDLDLSSDGNTLVVGAPGESSKASGLDGDQSDVSQPNTGAAYIFSFSEGAWAQTSYLKASNSDAADLFGSRVAVNLAGDNVVVGAPGESGAATALHGNAQNNTASAAGAVYVFEKTGEQWFELSYVKSPNTESGDAFGSMLGIDASGDVLAVAAPNEDSAANSLSGDRLDNTANESGAIYLY